jgi:hypothetical protein
MSLVFQDGVYIDLNRAMKRASSQKLAGVYILSASWTKHGQIHEKAQVEI